MSDRITTGTGKSQPVCADLDMDMDTFAFRVGKITETEYLLRKQNDLTAGVITQAEFDKIYDGLEKK